MQVPHNINAQIASYDEIIAQAMRQKEALQQQQQLNPELQKKITAALRTLHKKHFKQKK